MARSGSDSAWIETLLEAGRADAVALRLLQRSVTYQELRSEVGRRAERLRAEGIGPGSTVALQVAPSFTYIEILLALWRIGAQVCLFDYRLKPAEVTAYQALCQPQFAIRGRDAMTGIPTVVEHREVVVTTHPDGAPARTAHSLVQFTSGSTGRPKIIGRTGASLVAEVERWRALDGTITAADRVLVLSSLTHTLGLAAGLLVSFASGATVVLSPRVFAADILRTLRDAEITFLMAAPFHHELLATARDGAPLHHLRCVISGGEKLRADVHEQFTRRYGIAIGEAYGMSEVGIIAVDLTGRLYPSSGAVVPGLPVELRDGEVHVELGDTPYLHTDDPDGFRGGWLRTRDRGSFDDAGHLTILGRSDSLAIIGGLKVDLAEIEAVLKERADIDEVVVLQGDGIEAYIGSRQGVAAGELLRWCAERMATYKVPRRLFVAAALPRTATGKLLRNRSDLHAAMHEPALAAGTKP